MFSVKPIWFVDIISIPEALALPNFIAAIEIVLLHSSNAISGIIGIYGGIINSVFVLSNLPTHALD